MSRRLGLHCVCWAGMILLVGLGTTSIAVASPPVTIRGIELPTVLSFYDRAREAAVAAGTDRGAEAVDVAAPSDGDAEVSDGAESNDSGLSTVDTIVIDPGHGAGNIGAVGVTGVAEKYLTLELAYAVRQRLQTHFPDLRVVLTRYWDREVALDERAHLANRLDADLLLSLHYNAATHQRAVGYETYFLSTRQAIPAPHDHGAPHAVPGRDPGPDASADSADEPWDTGGSQSATIRHGLERADQHRFSGLLAEIVQSSLGEQLDSVDRGVKQANFAVLREALMPAVVVEAGFLTHPDEGEACLQAEHRRSVVDGLIEAVRTFDRKRTADRAYRAAR